MRIQMHVGGVVRSVVSFGAVLLALCKPALAQVDDSSDEDSSQELFLLTSPETTISPELRDFQRALDAYQAETTEYQEDLDRLIETEYENRRSQIQETYERQIENARVEERELRLNAISQLESFVEAYPTSEPATPDALLRLAQLTFEDETETFLLADADYSEALERYEAGQLPDLPEEPLLDFAQTASVCRHLVTAFPAYRQVDSGQYLLGYVSLQMGLEYEAVEAFADLVGRFPDSEYAAEAWLRMGEVYFDRNDFQTAIAAYLRASEDVENRLFDEALFKLETGRSMDFDDCPGVVDWEVVEQYQDELQETQDYVAFLEAATLFDEGHYRAAADAFSRLAERTPTRAYAAEALYHAGLAMERALDHSNAVRIYEQFLEEFADLDRVEGVVTRLAEINARHFYFEKAANYYGILAGLSEDEAHVQRALLERARLQEYVNELDDSAAAYLTFAERFPEQPDAPWALYRAGRLFERAGEYEAMQRAWSNLRLDYGGEAPAEPLMDSMVIDTLARTADYYRTVENETTVAVEYYQEVLREFEARDAADLDSIYSAAQAQFELAEMAFATWNSNSISRSVVERRATLARMFIEDVPNLVNTYAEVYEIGSTEWTIAAYVMVGHVYLTYADRLYTACIDELDCGYRDELEATISRCEDTAIEHWVTAVEVAGGVGLVNEWTHRASQALNRFLGDDYPMFNEEAEHLQRDHVTPLPLILPDS